MCICMCVLACVCVYVCVTDFPTSNIIILVDAKEINFTIYKCDNGLPSEEVEGLWNDRHDMTER